MSKSDVAETDILELIFNATAWDDFAQNDGSTPATDIACALHTGDPGEAGNQSTSEAAYTSYARKNVVRTSGGWTVAAGSCSPVAAITFVTATGGGETESHCSFGPSPATTANYMVYSGTVTPNIVVSSGVTPELTTATAITED